jgi:DNA-binding PadR family transcriptional regulator
MAPRTRSNPLALAVLNTLYERPMHPYEISQTLRTRAKHESIRLNYGSLYGVVAGLERRHLIRAVETVREGRRPQRTVYEITDAGATEMYEWLAELIAVPVKEYLQYEAGLSLLHGIPPDEAVALLRQRCDTLEFVLDRDQAVHRTAEKRGLPRLFFVENEYKQALLQAELEFTRRLIADIESGELTGLDQWQNWHDGADGASSGDDTNDTDGDGDDTNDDDDTNGDDTNDGRTR